MGRKTHPLYINHFNHSQMVELKVSKPLNKHLRIIVETHILYIFKILEQTDKFENYSNKILMYSTTCTYRGYKYHGNTCKLFIY